MADFDDIERGRCNSRCIIAPPPASGDRGEQSNGLETSGAIPAPAAPPGAPQEVADGTVLAPRKRGRPKGSLNRSTREVKALLRPALPQAKRRLRRLIESNDPEISLRAVQLIFAYVYGKPTERRELSGPEGGPHLIEFLRELPG